MKKKSEKWGNKKPFIFIRLNQLFVLLSLYDNFGKKKKQSRRQI